MTFTALLNGAEMAAPELFARAWALWGANVRAMTADAVGAREELQAAQVLFGYLSSTSATSKLSAKQLTQCSTVILTLNSLIVVAEPVPELARKPEPEPAPAASAHAYAGMRAAPDAGALPAPSLLVGSKLRAPAPAPAPVAATAAAPSDKDSEVGGDKASDVMVALANCSMGLPDAGCAVAATADESYADGAWSEHSYDSAQDDRPWH